MHQHHNLFLHNKQMGLMPLHLLTDVYFKHPAMIIGDVIINIIVPVPSLDDISSMGRFVFAQSLFHSSCRICCVVCLYKPCPCALMGSAVCLCSSPSVLFCARGAAQCSELWQQGAASCALVHTAGCHSSSLLLQCRHGGQEADLP